MMGVKFQKGDIFAVLLVLLAAAGIFACFLPKKDDPIWEVEIYLSGRLVDTLSPGENKTVTVSGKYENIISVSGGKAAVIESTCPGGECVKSGWISKPGRSIVCIPNGLEIRLVSNEKSADFIVR